MELKAFSIIYYGTKLKIAKILRFRILVWVQRAFSGSYVFLVGD
jgi:hypothetical protein